MSGINRPRSALYVPADKDRALAKALSLGADAIILDLEDAVTPEAKAAARAAGAAFIASAGPDAPIIVRINGLDTPEADDDIAAIAPKAPVAVLVPKVSAPEDVWRARRLCLLAKPPRPIAFWAMIETAAGVLAAPQIADAVGGEGALVMGLNDLAKDTRARQEPGRIPMLTWLSHVVLAARAAGAGVLDGVHGALDDPDGLAAECRQGRALGFDGKTLIHPSQIAPANAAFGPTEAEIAAAEAIVAAFADPANAGRGVIRLDGSMVERLHLAEAEETLRLARRRGDR